MTKHEKVLDLDSAAKLISALILLDQFLQEIRATIHVLEAFQDLDLNLDENH